MYSFELVWVGVVLSRGATGTQALLCLQDPGSCHGHLQHQTEKPEKGLRTAQNPEAGAPPEEELSEAGKAVRNPGTKAVLLLLNTLVRLFWLHLVPPSVNLWMLWNLTEMRCVSLARLLATNYLKA